MKGLLHSWVFLCLLGSAKHRILPEGKSLLATQSGSIAIFGIRAYEEPKVRKVR